MHIHVFMQMIDYNKCLDDGGEGVHGSPLYFAFILLRATGKKKVLNCMGLQPHTLKFCLYGVASSLHVAFHIKVKTTVFCLRYDFALREVASSSQLT